MTVLRLAAAATTAALALGSTAVAADGPKVAAQKTLDSTTAPITIPGTGVKRGDELPAGSRLIFRTVTLMNGQKATTTLKAPSGKKLRGLAPVGDVGFVVQGRSSYVGKRSVTIRAFSPSDNGDRSGASGRIYALVR